MSVKKNSVTVEERLETGEPYKLWDADLYACPECATEIITGFGHQPLVEHYQPSYATSRDNLAPIYPGRCRTVDEEAARRVASTWADEVAAMGDCPECGGRYLHRPTCSEARRDQDAR